MISAKNPGVENETEGEGVRGMRKLLLIFACKGKKYVDTGGGGQKSVKFCVRSLWMAPKLK